MRNLSIRKMNGLLKGKKTGFTLVELIIVIAIIAILAAIAIPKFGEIREDANIKADIANAKNIQTAVTAGVSNGDIALSTASVDLATVLNGTIPVGKAGEQKGDAFTAAVAANGEVTVSLGGVVVLPNPTDGGIYDVG